MRLQALFVGILAASAEAATLHRGRCTSRTPRVPWSTLTAAEKSAYIQADLCLLSLPAQSIDSDVVSSRWDELVYSHAAQVDYIHEVGAFLPWHRYWDEPLDAGNLTASIMFDPEADTSFGGNGTGPNSCVQDGPFANTTLHIQDDLSYTETCLRRIFDDKQFSLGAQSAVDECMAKETFIDFWHCIERGPHSAGHGGVAGTMISVAVSPGDPIFWLHHTYLDKLFSDWQSQNLTTRLTEIGGSNLQDLTAGEGGPPGGGEGNFTVQPSDPDPRFVDYFNDGGNVTTLNHTLWSAGIMANATIADVMDATGDYVCAEYS
ncbi:amino acid transporter [Fusarium sporotrichioides]|uniref:Amino acid transporter n=1 Tax=Fusarium sporotrichioides TaxID=5514 RepID=A0A395RSX0_FUSSP|nr:amino acid transporter [Fusarium sporotrichioides]